MVRIYVHNKPLFLVDKLTGEMEDYLHRPETIFIDELNTPAVKTMLHELEKDGVYAGIFLHSDLQTLFNAFKSHLTLIQAAGGLVYTKDRKILLIFRRGKWDLPKGKLDEGEDLEECAMREVKEETGITQVELESPLTVTYHTYREGEKHILKESYWYLMKSDRSRSLRPQTEEDIEKCEWVDLSALLPYVSNMHASIVDVIKEAEQKLTHKIT